MKFTDVGVGIVGLGGMGQLHANSVRELGATVVAGADVAPPQRDRFGTEFGVPTYEDYADLVADEAVDAVVVTTPNRFHEPIAIAALKAGCDVLVEKPLAHTLESAERIAAAAAEADGNCMVGFHNRHTAGTSMLTEHHARGRFGELTHVEADYVRRRGVPNPGSWFTTADLAGGGALIDIGVHALDLALYVLGFPEVVEVSGRTRSTFGREEAYADPDGFSDGWAADAEAYEVDDSVSAFIRCAGGETISLEAAWATNREPSSKLHVRGTEAGARMDIGGTDLTILETDTVGCDHYADTKLSGDASITGYKEQDREFLACAAEGHEPATNTVEEALSVQRVIDAIYRSSETGRAVEPARGEQEAAPTIRQDHS